MAELYRLTMEDRLCILQDELKYFRYKLEVIQLMKPNRDPADEMLGDLNEREKFYEAQIQSTQTRIKNLIDYGETPDFWKTNFTKTLIIYTDEK